MDGLQIQSLLPAPPSALLLVSGNDPRQAYVPGLRGFELYPAYRKPKKDMGGWKDGRKKAFFSSPPQAVLPPASLHSPVKQERKT